MNKKRNERERNEIKRDKGTERGVAATPPLAPLDIKINSIKYTALSDIHFLICLCLQRKHFRSRAPRTTQLRPFRRFFLSARRAEQASLLPLLYQFQELPMKLLD
jgi:hypothetical protein